MPLRAIQSASEQADMWKKLHGRYVSNMNSNKIFLLTSLINMKYQVRKYMGEHDSECEGIINQLNVMGAKLDDSLQMTFLLLSLVNPSEVKSVVTAIKTLSGTATWGSVTTYCRRTDEIRVLKRLKIGTRSYSRAMFGSACKLGGVTYATVLAT